MKVCVVNKNNYLSIRTSTRLSESCDYCTHILLNFLCIFVLFRPKHTTLPDTMALCVCKCLNVTLEGDKIEDNVDIGKLELTSMEQRDIFFSEVPSVNMS